MADERTEAQAVAEHLVGAWTHEGVLSIEGSKAKPKWHDPAFHPREPVPVLAEYYLFNRVENEIAQHIVWHVNGEWRSYPSTTGTAYVKRWRYLGDLPFQERVQPWMMACFGAMIAGDHEERNHRFLEEALELVQAAGCTAAEAHQLVDHVFGRPAGEPSQEVGGVMVTLAALCLAHGLDMHADAETELSRIWTKVEQIRAKQARKPRFSPLPGASC